MGIANGYVAIIHHLAAKPDSRSMLGRLMSLMFAAVGLNPISMAVSGFSWS
jgi:hypothetical protein